MPAPSSRPEARTMPSRPWRNVADPTPVHLAATLGFKSVYSWLMGDSLQPSSVGTVSGGVKTIPGGRHFSLPGAPVARGSAPLREIAETRLVDIPCRRLHGLYRQPADEPERRKGNGAKVEGSIRRSRAIRAPRRPPRIGCGGRAAQSRIRVGAALPRSWPRAVEASGASKGRALRPEGRVAPSARLLWGATRGGQGARGRRGLSRCWASLRRGLPERSLPPIWRAPRQQGTSGGSTLASDLSAPVRAYQTHALPLCAAGLAAPPSMNRAPCPMSPFRV